MLINIGYIITVMLLSFEYEKILLASDRVDLFKSDSLVAYGELTR